ncbi:MAG: RES family NAD+ phosphorylase [Acidimicrobiales bacterium]
MVRVAVDQLGSTEPSSSPTPRRFSPVLDRNSRRIPVLYAGASLACALGETVFHDLGDDPSTPGEVFRSDLIAVRSGTIALGVDCRLANLTDGALADYGYRRDEVIDTQAAEYPVTRRWGQHAWDTTGLAGLVWNSRRSPGELSFMLFVDPPRPVDRARALRRREHLDVVSPPLALYDGPGLAAVMLAAAERNVTVVV